MNYPNSRGWRSMEQRFRALVDGAIDVAEFLHPEMDIEYDGEEVRLGYADRSAVSRNAHTGQVSMWATSAFARTFVGMAEPQSVSA